MKAAILGHPRKRPKWSRLDSWSMFSEKEAWKWQDSHGFVMNVFAGCGGGRPIMAWGQEILDSIKSPHRIGLEFTGRNFLEFLWLLFSFVVKYFFFNFQIHPKPKMRTPWPWPMVVARQFQIVSTHSFPHCLITSATLPKMGPWWAMVMDKVVADCSTYSDQLCVGNIAKDANKMSGGGSSSLYQRSRPISNRMKA